MQAKKHGDLSTKPAANSKSGRVQTMFEEKDQTGQNTNNPEEMEDYNEMAALLEKSASPINIKRGDVVEGVIVRIDQDEILVDIGLKSEGVLPTKELPLTGYGSFNELHINDKVLVYVVSQKRRMGTPFSRSNEPMLSDSGASPKNSIGIANCSRPESSTITREA